MGVTLVSVDHHITHIDFSRKNIEVVKVNNLEEFYKKVREFLLKDYDLIISDEDPDGITSVIIYYLFKKKTVNFEGNRKGLNNEDLKRFETLGIKFILSFDWFALNTSDLDIFEKIIYLNPINSNLINVNTSEITYRSLPETKKIGRDISVIGTICDYLVDNCKDKFKEFIEDYKDLFSELVDLVKEGKLDRYNAYSFNGNKTLFYDLSLMFWAPFIIEGDEGNKKLIDIVVNNKNFNIRNLLNENNYLREMLIQLNSLIENEKENFYKNRKVIGNLNFYNLTTHKNGFTSKFSSIIADELPKNLIVVMKDNSSDKIKYSLRTRSNDYNLGKTLADLNVGGGHVKAAGCVIDINKEEWFENELMKRFK